MEHRAKSISVGELKEMAAKAADVIKAERVTGIGKGEIGYFPDWGVVGGKVRDFDLAKLDAQAVYEMSANVANRIGAAERGLKPVVRIERDILIFGYFPPEPIVFEQF